MPPSGERLQIICATAFEEVQRYHGEGTLGSMASSDPHDATTAAVHAIATAKGHGAVLSLEAVRNTLLAARAEGLSQDDEGRLLEHTFRTAKGLLPPSTVARRALWSRYEFVLEGPQGDLISLGRRLLQALSVDEQLTALNWHLVFIKVFNAEPLRTFMCDPGYDLGGRIESLIAWVEPYAKADWRESQRYPTVTFLPLIASP